MDCDFSPSSPHLLPNGLFSPQNRISFELLALSGLSGFSTFKGGKMLIFQGFANSRIVREFPPFSFKVRIATLTRNRFVLNRARGFESHHLSRKKSTGSGWCFFVSNRISPSFKKYVSIIFAQSLLKRIDKMNCRFTARTRSPLTPLPPVRHSLLFPVAGT